MKDWLSQTIELHKEYESPLRYYYWSLLSTVSAILMDKVYFDKYLYKLYPNVYVMLFGPSAIKKGPPISLATDIVNYVGCTRVISGRSTIEAIMKRLQVDETRNGKGLLKHNNGFIVSSEMSSAIVSSTSSLDIITDLFDRIYRNGEWIYDLKNSPAVKLKNPTITWLAGTNEALFKEFIPEKNMKGGLIGRTFIISENKRNRINSLMFKPKVLPDREEIAKGIKPIIELKGEFKMQDELREAFDTWYINFSEKVVPTLDDAGSGVIGRTDDNILRVAMLISSARRADLEIIDDDLKEAMEVVLPLLIPTKRIVNSAKNQELGSTEKRALILSDLANRKDYRVNRQELLQKFALKMDHMDLDVIIQFLESAGLLLSENKGSATFYRLNMKNEKVAQYIRQYEH